MIITRQKLFSEKRISSMDEANLISAKMLPKGFNRMNAEYWSDDDKTARKGSRKISTVFAAPGALVGGAIGYTSAPKGKAGKYATIGTLAGGAGYYALGRLSSEGSIALRKNDKYRKLANKTRDQYRVGAGDMTKEEYRQKYGK